MIRQIAPIPQTTTRPITLNKDLLKIRRIQHKLKERGATSTQPDNGLLWSPLTPGPFLVPITRWIE